MINELDLQAFLFEKEASRMELLNFDPSLAPAYKVFVCRNHSFELIENTIKPYLEFGKIGVEFSYSSYDDSLSFLEMDVTADLVLLWLDLSAYKVDNLAQFIEERLQQLREVYDGNVLFAPLGEKVEIDTKKLQIQNYDLSNIQKELGDKFLDLRLEQFAGTKLSSQANLNISRDLGLNYLPTLLKPNLKCIIVDLDNSLYRGVLGEDGVDGVVLTEGHQRLQQKLKQLGEQGFFLCVASKNDHQDVVNLFENRSDFPLKIDDFVEVHANWGSKADSITSIAKALNISVDSMLFVDDNMGELVSVLEMHPDLNIVWAKDDATITSEVVENYPGLLKLDSKKEDALRRSDTLANKQRQKMQSSLTTEEYIKDLQMSLLFEVDAPENVERVSELSNKTNQFIFSYQRYTLQQVEEMVSSKDASIVAVSLSDRLSDSGIIGVVILKRSKQGAVLEECFVSCRALGRGIDQAIVLGAVSVALNALELSQLTVNFSKGERNLPAEKFNDDHFREYNKGNYSEFDYQIPENLISIKIK